MSLTSYFFHKTIRRIVVSFATLFNGYKVTRPDNTTVDVPITWTSKAKWYTMLKQRPNQEKIAGLMLPRMGFSITNIAYNFNRKISSINKISKKDPLDSNKAYVTYTPVPYDIDFGLYIATKTVDDGLQLIEQILPYFTPSFNITIIEIDNISVPRDLPIRLNTVTTDFLKEGPFDGSDMYLWEMNFTVEANIYKNVDTLPIIKKVIVDIYPMNDANTEAYKERYTALVDPESAYITDEYQILESLGLVEPGTPKL